MEVLEPWSLLLWRAFCSREIQLDDKEGRFLHSNLWDSCKFVEDRNNYAFLSSWLAQSLLIRFVSIHKNLKETERNIHITLLSERETYPLREMSYTDTHSFSLFPFPLTISISMREGFYPSPYLPYWLLIVDCCWCWKSLESNTINPKELGGLQLVTQRTHTED